MYQDYFSHLKFTWHMFTADEMCDSLFKTIQGICFCSYSLVCIMVNLLKENIKVNILFIACFIYRFINLEYIYVKEQVFYNGLHKVYLQDIIKWLLIN